MLLTLEAAERELPTLLEDPASWQSLRITYEKPHVERLWRAWGDYRLSLHRIHPCAPEEAFLHRHPWPSAVKIVSGHYEMIQGYSETERPPDFIVSTSVLVAGVCYEMLDADGWHSVRPLGAPSLSVMVTGIPWTKRLPAPGHVPEPLTADERDALLAEFRARYSTRPVM